MSGALHQQTMRGVLALTPRRLRQLWYAPLLALAMGLMMLRLLVLARWLSVPAFAEFSGGLLVSGSFCMLGCLGLQSMLQREWPVDIVRGRELRGLVRAMQCLVVASVCAGVGLVAALAGVSLIGLSPALLAIGLLHGVSQQMFLIATLESRSRGDSLRFSGQNLWRSVAAFGLGVAIAWWSGDAFLALLSDAILTGLLALFYFRHSIVRSSQRIGLVLPLALRGLRSVRWRTAMTLTLLMAVGFGLLNADRWVASSRLDRAGFAVYSFAWIVLSLAQSVQVVINASVYPMLARRFAAGGRAAAFRVACKVSLAVLVLGAVPAVPVAMLLTRAVAHWYPQYAAAIALLPLFFAISLLRVSDFWSSFLLVLGLERPLLQINAVVALAVSLVWAAIFRQWNGLSVAPLQVAWLAAMLTTGVYVVVFAMAWRARKP